MLAAKRLDPRILQGLYQQMMKPGFEMPVPYSRDVPRQSISRWSPGALEPWSTGIPNTTA